jgi:cob(I)alamin adenosyltransferase
LNFTDSVGFFVFAFIGKEKIEIKTYTGSGDDGKTSLFSGERVSKDLHRVEAYGDVDELNSVIGVLVTLLSEKHSGLIKDLQEIQSNLLRMGAWLATTPDSHHLALLEKISERHIKALERAMDRMQASLPQLKGFILPGGHMTAAWAHVARTVCRRAERHVIPLDVTTKGGRGNSGNKEVLAYLNRLSDYLFVLARYCNQMFGVSETLWKGSIP